VFVTPFFSELPALVRTISEGRQGGVLRIEAAALEMQHVLPGWVARLRAQRPQLRVELQEVAVGEPARLLRGEADIVVDYQASLPAGVEGECVAVYHAFLVAPQRVLPRAVPAARLATALHSLPFTGFLPRLPPHALQRAGLERLGLAYSSELGASSTEAILAMVTEGLGFSLLPWPEAMGPRRRGLAVQRLRGAGTQFDVIAAFRARTSKDPLVEAALAAARHGARPRGPASDLVVWRVSR
jgi:DNA-binding transcriptional LysR family regulator